MIKFNYTLSDTEAEDLVGLIQNEIVRCKEYVMHCWGSDKDPTPFKNRISYLQELKNKVTSNTIHVE